MQNGAARPEVATLDDFIEAYEDAQAQTGQAEVADFLPPADHPLHRDVLRELVRVDLEYGWQLGRPQPLESYRQRFPHLFQDPDSVHAVAFEEFRLRRQAGEMVCSGDYQKRYGVDTSGWPVQASASALLDEAGYRQEQVSEAGTPTPLSDAGDGLDEGTKHATSNREAQHAPLPGDPHRSDPMARAFPAVGETFCGFDLIAELGRGAFARVYLARQADLARRLVALKVSGDLWNESQTLAQLQHTNIVPIYSVHRVGRLQSVCMPYLGAITLADVLKELQERHPLPRSGKGLLSTLASRRNSTVPPDEKQLRPSHSTPVPAEAPQSETEPAHPSRPVPSNQLEQLSFENAVLTLGQHLADGLAHAHDRGILHRDLKPANVLITHDGVPMLLDFNLSEDTKVRGNLSAAMIGGTLPYMAPEHLEAFQKGGRRVDGRADVYALGVILYELLTGRLPYPIHRGPVTEVVARMLADRMGSPPLLRRYNRAMSAASEAIVRRCLEPVPNRRYATAGELKEDLECQLGHRPLRHTREPSLRERGRKWVRRHPRWTVAAVVCSVLGGVLLTIAAQLITERLRNDRLETVNAVKSAAIARRQFRDDMKAVQVRLLGDPAPRDGAMEECARLLGRYGVPDNPDWQKAPAFAYLPASDQEELREDVAELLLLWARAVREQGGQSDDTASRPLAMQLNTKAEQCFSADRMPRAVWLQRASLATDPSEVKECLVRAETQPSKTARDRGMLASEYAMRGQYSEALALLDRASLEQPQHFTIWFDLGVCHEVLERPGDAAACYSTCIALAPELAPLYLKRGTAFLRLRRFEKAAADFSRAIELKPTLAEAHLQRALARVNLAQPRHELALQDLGRALELGSPSARVLFMRAAVYERMGNVAEAKRQRLEALRQNPTDEASWLARGSAQRRDDPRAALKDFEQALALNPRSLPAHQNIAHLLAERLDRPQDAIDVLDRAIRLYPDAALARAGRGVLLARQKNRTAAVADAEQAVARDPQPRTLYQVAGIYALTSEQHADDRFKAFELLSAALRQGYGFDQIDQDPDLKPIAHLPEFRRLVDAARAMRSTPK
ncbi:MAG: protein kinase [Gemmataceae bacterium]|nr:protein kinase [Gemmataceae bacterium]